jgi:flagellar basal body rod protein FlgG
MPTHKRNAVIITLLSLLTLLSVPDWNNSPDTSLICVLESRESKQNRQLDLAHLNLKLQFQPGYKARTLGEDGSLRIDPKQGKIFRTNSKTNLAIHGKGYFCLEGSGETLYTRDGRFEFMDGILRHESGRALLGFPLDSQGGICGKETTLKITMDPENKLYQGRYTDYQFDEAGRFRGISKLTDPVTGQSVTTVDEPLFIIMLGQFENPAELSPLDHALFRASEKPFLGVAGQLETGQILPSRLELSNVNSDQQVKNIVQVKEDIRNREEGTLFLRHALSPESSRTLTGQGIVLMQQDGLTTLEGRSSRHLFLALNTALDRCCDTSEVEALTRAMESLEPRFVVAE